MVQPTYLLARTLQSETKSIGTYEFWNIINIRAIFAVGSNNYAYNLLVNTGTQVITNTQTVENITHSDSCKKYVKLTLLWVKGNNIISNDNVSVYPDPAIRFAPALICKDYG